MPRGRCKVSRWFWRRSLLIVALSCTCCLAMFSYMCARLFVLTEPGIKGLLAQELSTLSTDFGRVGDVEEVIFLGADPVFAETDAVLLDEYVDSRDKGYEELHPAESKLDFSLSKQISPIWSSIAKDLGGSLELSRSKKYMIILGHYEQLGKATVNFVHAGSLAAQMERSLVIPFVRHSRFCGLQAGWHGEKRKKSREFLPMDNYFDMNSVVELFRSHSLSELVTLNEFVDKCSAIRGQQLAIIYFIYAGDEMKRYLKLSDFQYQSLLQKLKAAKGWIDCSFIEKTLNNSSRMPGVKVGKQFCVHAEMISSVKHLEIDILNRTPCVAILYWRGVGFQRTHFNISLPSEYAKFLSQLDLSKSIKAEADQFIASNFHGQNYLSIQIRSERQLSWYGLEKFHGCVDLVLDIAKMLMQKKDLNKVFISSDIGLHGSDTLQGIVNASTFHGAEDLVMKLTNELSSASYQVLNHRDLMRSDNGFVALAQMEIMARSQHLVTLGNGTFQQWLVFLFKRYKSHHSWSVSRACSQELKNPLARTSSGMNIPSPVKADV